TTVFRWSEAGRFFPWSCRTLNGCRVKQQNDKRKSMPERMIKKGRNYTDSDRLRLMLPVFTGQSAGQCRRQLLLQNLPHASGGDASHARRRISAVFRQETTTAFVARHTIQCGLHQHVAGVVANQADFGG